MVKAGGRTRARDIPIRDYWAILLDAGRPQPGEAVVINRTLPSEKFLDRPAYRDCGPLRVRGARRERLQPLVPCDELPSE
jgi:hypothetical protein